MFIVSVIVIGLFCLIVMGASQKFGRSGTLGVFFGALAIPAFASLIWRSSIVLSWWTVAIFIGLSLIVGLMAKAARQSEEAINDDAGGKAVTSFFDASSDSEVNKKGINSS